MSAVVSTASDTVLFVNSAAGAAESEGGSLVELARDYGVRILEAECLQERSPGSCSTKIRQLVDEGTRRVIVAGGDGSIHRIVNALAPDFLPLEVGVIPLGTGNDLARSLAIPHEPEDAFRHALMSASTPIDLLSVRSGSHRFYMINAATGGFGAEVTSQVDSETKGRWGAAAYWLTALNHYLHLTQYDVIVSAEELQFNQPVYGIAIGNGCYAGGGFMIAPDGKLDDGYMEVYLLPVLPTLDLLATSAELSLAGSLESDRLIAFRSRRLRFRATPGMPFSVDGELIELADVTFEIEPGRVRLCCGEEAATLQPSSWCA